MAFQSRNHFFLLQFRRTQKVKPFGCIIYQDSISPLYTGAKDKAHQVVFWGVGKKAASGERTDGHLKQQDKT